VILQYAGLEDGDAQLAECLRGFAQPGRGINPMCHATVTGPSRRIDADLPGLDFGGRDDLGPATPGEGGIQRRAVDLAGLEQRPEPGLYQPAGAKAGRVDLRRYDVVMLTVVRRGRVGRQPDPGGGGSAKGSAWAR
jgi:hypothetical protein